MDSLMTVKEAAQYLNLNYMTVYKLAQRGKIPASKVGGNWRFRKEILDGWLTQQYPSGQSAVAVVDDDAKMRDLINDIANGVATFHDIKWLKQIEEELVRDRDQLEEMVRERNQQLEAISGRLREIQEEDSGNIVSEAHDEISEAINTLQLTLNKHMRSHHEIVNSIISEVLVASIRHAFAEQRRRRQTLSERAIDAYMEKMSPHEVDLLLKLTPRERQVLRMVAQGYTNKEISMELGVSHRTIESHRASIMRRLSLHNQYELLNYLFRNRAWLAEAGSLA